MALAAATVLLASVKYQLRARLVLASGAAQGGSAGATGSASPNCGERGWARAEGQGWRDEKAGAC